MAVWLLEGGCYILNQFRVVQAAVVLLHASPSLSAILGMLHILRVEKFKDEGILRASSSASNDLRLVVVVQSTIRCADLVTPILICLFDHVICFPG